jgi:cell division protein FtsI (penicillin-binding protein 3)
MLRAVIRPETSEKMRFLMRLNAEIGTAKKADVRGYYIGGKTGTAELRRWVDKPSPSMLKTLR